MSESNEVQHANTERARIEAGGAGASSSSNDLTNRALAILLGKDDGNEGTDGNEGEGDDGTEGAGEKPNKATDKGAKPKTFAEAAEKFGMSMEELYGLTLQVQDDQDSEAFTVGALKDAMKERTDFKLSQISWGEERAAQEGELMRARNEVTELIALIPKGTIKPEVVQQIREKHENALKVERERTIAVIPEWRNEKVRGEEMTKLREHLTRSGFPPNYLDQVSDHRTFRYIRENMLREQRITAALELVKRQKTKGSAPSPRGNSMRSATKPTGNQRGVTAEGQKVNAISQLLRGT